MLKQVLCPMKGCWVLLVPVLLGTACGTHRPSAAPPSAAFEPTTVLPPWETVDATFNGCEGG